MGQPVGKVCCSQAEGRWQLSVPLSPGTPCPRAMPSHPRAPACALTQPPAWLLQAGKNWMFSNAKSPPHCELMAGHLRNRITADGAHFELRLHLIYLINDVLHHW